MASMSFRNTDLLWLSHCFFDLDACLGLTSRYTKIAFWFLWKHLVWGDLTTQVFPAEHCPEHHTVSL